MSFSAFIENRLRELFTSNPSPSHSQKPFYTTCLIIAKFNLVQNFLNFSNYRETNTFDSIETATRVRDSLNGCDIYSGCCTLKIDYAKVCPIFIYILFTYLKL